ncbi:unnamed protein product [Caenorhabditis bovis]|uniref:Uncharacterized protein n=1 Tax=Caenorhabditis bovis TaxID=2654633 RepID=A0A8S1F6U8_9PELO|nr:unnamed protein product [Caenorhabditis bovis]
MENDFNCSLSYFIFNSFKPHEFYYNCTSNDNVGEIQKPLGIYFISSGLFILILYTLCLIAMAKSDLMRSSCYKIMMLLGILDIICTFTNSLATGFLGYEGATFCSYPRFIFVMGSIGCGCWIGSCLICVILGINRCCDMNPNLKIRFIFQGSRTYIVIGVISILTLCETFFTKPFLFNSNYMCWFFDPKLGLKHSYYINKIHTIVNCCTSILITTIYLYLCIFLKKKGKISPSGVVSKVQRQVFIQSILICSFNAIASYIYVYMQLFYSPPFLVLIGQISWQWSHGSVCVVYLIINRTIRKRVINLLISEGIQKRIHIGTLQSSSLNAARS